jgi:hypothetical protein
MGLSVRVTNRWFVKIQQQVFKKPGVKIITDTKSFVIIYSRACLLCFWHLSTFLPIWSFFIFFRPFLF